MKNPMLLILLFISFVTFSQNEILHYVPPMGVRSEMMRSSLLQQKDKMFVSKSISPDSLSIIDTNYFNDQLKNRNLYEDFQQGNLSNEIISQVFNQSIMVGSVGESNEKSIDEEREAYIRHLQEENAQLQERSERTTFAPPPPPPPPTIEPMATLTYVIKDTMMVGETYTIDLTLSKDLSEQLLVKIIDGFKGKSLIDTLIVITPVMRARLLDPGKSFQQEPITAEIQSTVGKDLVRWQWQVIPLKEGNISLTISVDNYIDGLPQNVNIYNGKTYVYATHTWYGDLWDWISTYWDKITYVLGGLIALLSLLYKEKIINVFKKNGK